MNENNIQEKILQILREHPEGLTQADISKIVGLSTASISKYIGILEALGRVNKREIGTANLVMLNEDR